MGTSTGLEFASTGGRYKKGEGRGKEKGGSPEGVVMTTKKSAGDMSHT